MLIMQTVQEYVDFVVNASYPRVLELLSEASIGLNTMVDEHFGINVVEFMVSTIFPNVVDSKNIRRADGVIVVLDSGRWRNTHRTFVRRTLT
jgi:hypothetical protein